MDLYEQVKLKGQKLNLSSLLSKPVFKQQYLAPIRTLSETHQCDLLTMVIEKNLSLHELKEQSQKMKSMHALKVAFARLTNSDSWEKAAEKFPLFGSDEQLARFVGCDLKKSIPRSFHDFCQRAMLNSKSTSHPQVRSKNIFNFNSNDGLLLSACVIQAVPAALTGQTIIESLPTFSGGDLCIIAVDSEVTK